MITSESIYKFATDPIGCVKYSNLMLVCILTPLTLFAVVGYYFSWHEISSSAIPFVSAILSFWLGLFVLGYLGSKNWKLWGRIATFFAWVPLLFAFPIGTLFAAWVIYSIFRKPDFS